MTATSFEHFSDNWLDIVSAIFTGFVIWWIQYSFQTSPNEMRQLLLDLVAFASVSLALSFWKHFVRIHLAWIAIAVLGVILISAIDEVLFRLTSTTEELSFMPEFSSFPLEIVIFLPLSLFIMAATHYLGRAFLVQMPRVFANDATQQIVEPERRKRLSHQA